MKKLLFLLIAIALSVSLSACGGSATSPTPDTTSSSVSTGENNSVEKSEATLVYENLQASENALGDTIAVYTAQIQNTGNVSIAFKSDASIDVEDSSGVLVTTEQSISIYPSVIAPGESAYISKTVVNNGVGDNIDADQISKAILNYKYEVFPDTEALAVHITDISISEKYNYPAIVARIENTGDTALSDVYIIAPVYSSDGILQTVIFTIIDELEPGEKKGFEQTAVDCVPGIDCSSLTADVYAFYPEYIY